MDNTCQRVHEQCNENLRVLIEVNEGKRLPSQSKRNKTYNDANQMCVYVAGFVVEVKEAVEAPLEREQLRSVALRTVMKDSNDCRDATIISRFKLKQRVSF